MTAAMPGQAAPWRAAWMAFIAVTDPDRDLSSLAGDDEADPQWVAAWEAAAQAAIAAQPQPAPELARLIGEAIGEASVCWNPRPEGEFDSAAAGNIVDRLLLAIGPQPAPELASLAGQLLEAGNDNDQLRADLAAAMTEARELRAIADEATRLLEELAESSRNSEIAADAARLRKRAGLSS